VEKTLEQATLSEFRVDGKVAVVTGASRSIGRASAVALAEAGADVVVSGRWREGIDRVCGEVEAHGRRALPVICDVSDAAQVESLMETTMKSFGALDILVANAGIFQEYKLSEEVTVEEWQRVIDTNLTGVAASCLSAGRRMIEIG
jgi:NAD(P)-dependent dehydrogenase (short-subunit alcohol dehydrogenase family)